VDPETGFASGAVDVDQRVIAAPAHAPILRVAGVIRASVQREGCYLIATGGNLLYCSHARGLVPTPLPSVNTQPIDIAFGGYHALVLTSDGRVLARGSGKNGKLGVGHGDDCHTWAPITSLGGQARAIACGRRHSAVVMRDGRLLTFGSNSYGRLGVGEANDRFVPAAVLHLPPIRAVSCGSRHTVAVAEDGSVFAWGYLKDGRCGCVGDGVSMVPRRVSGVSDVVDVTCGPNTTAAVTRAGDVYVWGVGRRYRLGTGSEQTVVAPQKLEGLQSIVRVCLGHEHGGAVCRDGSVYAWGHGGLASGLPNATTPVLLEGLGRVSGLSCGDNVTLAWRTPRLSAEANYSRDDAARQAALAGLASAARAARLESLLPHLGDAANLVDAAGDGVGEGAADLRGASAVGEPAAAGGGAAGNATSGGPAMVGESVVDADQTAAVGMADTSEDALGSSLFVTATVATDPDDDVILPPLPQEAQQGQALSGAAPTFPLLVLLANLPSAFEAKQLLPTLLEAWMISLARDVSLLWLEHASEVLDQEGVPTEEAEEHTPRATSSASASTSPLPRAATDLDVTRPWDAALLLRLLMDILRMTHASAATAALVERVQTSVIRLIARHDHLLPVLVELCEYEVSLPLSEELSPELWSLRQAEEENNDDNGGSVAEQTCNLPFIHITVDAARRRGCCTASVASRLVHALSLLWLRSEKSDLRAWILSRMLLLLTSADAEVLGHLRTELDKLADVGGAVASVQESHDDQGDTFCGGVQSPTQSEKKEADGEEAASGPGESEAVSQSEGEREGGPGSGTAVRESMGHTSDESDSDDEADDEEDRRSGRGSVEDFAQLDGQSDGTLSTHEAHVLTKEFAHCNASGTGLCDLLELSLLLGRQGLRPPLWRLQQHITDVLSSIAGADDGSTARRLSMKAVHILVEQLQDARTQASSAMPTRSIFRDGDAGTGDLRAFASSLWSELSEAYNVEMEAIKAGRRLIFGKSLRAMVSLAYALNLLAGDSQARPVWFKRYCDLTDIFRSLAARRPFPSSFKNTIARALAARGVNAKSLQQQLGKREARAMAHLDNVYFTREMDEQLLHWKTASPDVLKLPFEGAALAINLPKLHFKSSNPGGSTRLYLSDDKRTAGMRASGSEENTWVVSDTTFYSGVHYWAMRCDAKGSARRYVGVGVGRVNCAFPAGTTRLLSDGNLKSAQVNIKIDMGFSEYDVVGVLLDMDQGIVSFDVNGIKRGEISLPDLMPGEGVRPLAYVFSPRDTVSCCQYSHASFVCRALSPVITFAFCSRSSIWSLLSRSLPCSIKCRCQSATEGDCPSSICTRAPAKQPRSGRSHHLLPCGLGCSSRTCGVCPVRRAQCSTGRRPSQARRMTWSMPFGRPGTNCARLCYNMRPPTAASPCHMPFRSTR
jgi:hypothetical protein